MAPGVVTMRPSSKRGWTRQGWLSMFMAWSSLRAPVNEAFTVYRGFAVVTAEVAGNRVEVEVILQPLGNFTEETFIDKVLGQFSEAAQFININIKVVGVACFQVEAVTALAHGED